MLLEPEGNYPDDNDLCCLAPGGLDSSPLLLLLGSPQLRLLAPGAKTADSLLVGPSAFRLLMFQQTVFDGAEGVGEAAMNRQTVCQEVEALVEC